MTLPGPQQLNKMWVLISMYVNQCVISWVSCLSPKESVLHQGVYWQPPMNIRWCNCQQGSLDTHKTCIKRLKLLLSWVIEWNNWQPKYVGKYFTTFYNGERKKSNSSICNAASLGFRNLHIHLSHYFLSHDQQDCKALRIQLE